VCSFITSGFSRQPLPHKSRGWLQERRRSGTIVPFGCSNPSPVIGSTGQVTARQQIIADLGAYSCAINDTVARTKHETMRAIPNAGASRNLLGTAPSPRKCIGAYCSTALTQMFLSCSVSPSISTTSSTMILLPRGSTLLIDPKSQVPLASL
jgi:hypothetical protein